MGNKPKEWVRWLSWAEYCYNTSVHTSTKKTSYEVVYGRSPPTLLSYSSNATSVEAVDKELADRDEVLKELRCQLQISRNRMKKFADDRRTERSFDVGDFVYLRLQPYKQVSISLGRNFKLSPQYYGPFEILQKIGNVAYLLKLPDDSCIHPVFYVSCLKKKIGDSVQVQQDLPKV